ncbi:CKL7 [Symbiodinium microadriaticum]|nr:CKL7 [Symbiodinium microadriaticum]
MTAKKRNPGKLVAEKPQKPKAKATPKATAKTKATKPKPKPSESVRGRGPKRFHAFAASVLGQSFDDIFPEAQDRRRIIGKQPPKILVALQGPFSGYSGPTFTKKSQSRATLHPRGHYDDRGLFNCMRVIECKDSSRYAAMPPKPPKEIGNGRFEVQKALGAGCFGQVWKGIEKSSGETVAIKFEDNQAKGAPNQLKTEYDTLRIISAANENAQGFSKPFWFGVEGRFSCLAMELLGRSLEDRMQQCGKKLTPQSCVLIIDQILRRLEFLHSLGLIHRDIKPENFMFGVGRKVHVLYLIDFGLGRRYWRDKQHAPPRALQSLTGTARYASINAHKGSVRLCAISCPELATAPWKSRSTRGASISRHPVCTQPELIRKCPRNRVSSRAMAVGSSRMQRAVSARSSRAARVALIAAAALAVLTEDKPGRICLGATLRILFAALQAFAAPTRRTLAGPERPAGAALVIRHAAAIPPPKGGGDGGDEEDKQPKIELASVEEAAEKVSRTSEVVNDITRQASFEFRKIFGFDLLPTLAVLFFAWAEGEERGKKMQRSRVDWLAFSGTVCDACMEQSRRDDLEAVGHMIFYFLRGSLPWSGLEAKSQEEKYRKIREVKETFPIEQLCEGHPQHFAKYLEQARNLKYTERPDYAGMRKMFASLRAEIGPSEDHDFEFLRGKDTGPLEPLQIDDSIEQPDDKVQKAASGQSVFHLHGFTGPFATAHVTLRFGMPEVTIRHSRCEQLQLAVLDLAEIWMSSSAASLIACSLPSGQMNTLSKQLRLHSASFGSFYFNFSVFNSPQLQCNQELQVLRGASPVEIREAFRRRALLTHPDKGGRPEEFHGVVAAFEILSDGSRRAAYDEQLQESNNFDGLSEIGRPMPGPDEEDPTTRALAEKIETFRAMRIMLHMLLSEKLQNVNEQLKKQSSDVLRAMVQWLLCSCSRSSNTFESDGGKDGDVSKNHFLEPKLAGIYREKTGGNGYYVYMHWSTVKCRTQKTNSLTEAVDWHITLTQLKATSQARMRQSEEDCMDLVKVPPLTEEEVALAYQASPTVRLSFSCILTCGRTRIVLPCTTDIHLAQKLQAQSGECLHRSPASKSLGSSERLPFKAGPGDAMQQRVCFDDTGGDEVWEHELWDADASDAMQETVVSVARTCQPIRRFPVAGSALSATSLCPVLHGISKIERDLRRRLAEIDAKLQDVHAAVRRVESCPHGPSGPLGAPGPSVRLEPGHGQPGIVPAKVSTAAVQTKHGGRNMSPKSWASPFQDSTEILQDLAGKGVVRPPPRFGAVAVRRVNQPVQEALWNFFEDPMSSQAARWYGRLYAPFVLTSVTCNLMESSYKAPAFMPQVVVVQLVLDVIFLLDLMLRYKMSWSTWRFLRHLAWIKIPDVWTCLDKFVVCLWLIG